MRKIIFFCALSLITLIGQSQTNKILVPYLAGNKWGYSDTLGKIQIAPAFEYSLPFIYPVHPVTEVFAVSLKSNDTVVVINDKGDIILSVSNCRDLEIVYKKKGVRFIIERKDRKFGVRNHHREIVPFEYDNIEDVSYEQFLAYKNGKITVFDADGNIVAVADKTDAAPQGGNITPPMIFSEQEILRTDKDEAWEKSIAKKYKAESSVSLDDITRNGASTVLYKGNEQALIFPSDRKEDPSFFSKDLKIETVTLLNQIDRNRFKAKAILIVSDSNGKYGLMTNRGKFVLPMEYESIYHDEEKRSVILIYKDSKYGIFMLNTFYPLIPAKYESIFEKRSVYVNDNWNFQLFKVYRNGKGFYVGENGVEYFSEK